MEAPGIPDTYYKVATMPNFYTDIIMKDSRFKSIDRVADIICWSRSRVKKFWTSLPMPRRTALS